jgi:hypothetical protein
MIGELFRPLLRWLFWNRHRPLLALAALLIAVAILGRLSGCGAGGPGSTPAPAWPPAVQAWPPATAAVSATDAVVPSRRQATNQPPASSPGSRAQAAAAGTVPAAALLAARAFLAAWVSRAGDRAARIRATATPQLAAQVTGPAAGLAPATAITGPVTVTGQAAGTVSVSVPTNAGTALLTVRLDHGRWLAAQVMLARTGD